MEVCRMSSWLLLLLGVTLLTTALQGVQGEVESEGPSESECRPYIEKALKELETDGDGLVAASDSKEDLPTVEITTDDDDHQDGDKENDPHDDGDNAETDQTDDEKDDTEENKTEEDAGSKETSKEEADSKEEGDSKQVESGEAKQEEVAEGEDKPDDSKEDGPGEQSTEDDDDSKKDDSQENEAEQETDKDEDSKEKTDTEEDTNDADDKQSKEDDDDTEEVKDDAKDDSKEDDAAKSEENEEEAQKTEDGDSKEDGDASQEAQADADKGDSKEDKPESGEDTAEETDDKEDSKEQKDESKEDVAEKSGEDSKETETAEDDATKSDETKLDSKEDDKESTEKEGDSKEDDKEAASKEDDKKGDSKENDKDGDSKEGDSKEGDSKEEDKTDEKDDDDDDKADDDDDDDENKSEAVEEELTLDIEIPEDLRPRDHVEHLLKLDQESTETENVINSVSEITLKELKKLYENAIKPLEILYKYRDLSNRHFGDSEIFSKPLVLFMGPWSGGKSSIINYLVNNEYNETSLRTGAEPSPAYFNILMYGDEPEIVEGTELAADFTFSGLQKFGQGLEERLRGVKLPTKLLEKVNIVEIPGILEVRKQVSRVFPFNDACQWFIDRADIIFLVYDPSKLDVGPETEAILDQLKGREHQTRIILNKADQVKPEELMRVQGALIWNISPLMSSPQPPIMYTTSLWSRPYESWAPVRLLQAQERAFLRDLRGAVDKRIENKIASARRFAVRVRNHAKMVDCYLTTYYNHKTVFGNRKQIADAIIEHPQDYHIYEGLSTLTNISRYDLPDPEVYKDFFKLNPLYEFQQLSATCTYFRGCPINRLDIAIAYDLPELVGTHRRNLENALSKVAKSSPPGS